MKPVKGKVVLNFVLQLSARRCDNVLNFMNYFKRLLRALVEMLCCDLYNSAFCILRICCHIVEGVLYVMLNPEYIS